MRLPDYAIILAGGYGTRFWPASRRARPKQFLALTGNESLLQQTYGRIARLFPRDRIYVVGNAEHRALLRRQLPQLPAKQLLLEPVGRNTAAAMALGAQHILDANVGKEAVLAVFPADHAIRNQARFRRVVRAGIAAAAGEDAMVVLGVPPTHTHTGYGYIERGRRLGRSAGQSVFAVRRFTEKPDARTAARYLRSRRYFWNSGMFFWRLSTFDRLLARHLPRTRAALARLASRGRLRHPVAVKQVYAQLQNISLDYALAEPAAGRGQARLLVAAMGWSDLGSWSALADWLGPSRGAPHFALDARGNFVRAPGKLDDDLIVVETPDALLFCRRDHAQDVGKVVDWLQKRKLHRWL